MPRRSLIIISLVFCALLAACGDDSKRIISGDEPDTLIIDFRDGVSPFPSYYGTRDAVIKNGPAESLRNLNWGGMERDTVGAAVITSGYYQRRLLLRWDLSEITSCEKVIEAELTLRIDPVYQDSVLFRLYRLSTPENIPDSWAEGDQSGGYNAGVCWDFATAAAPWDSPGGDYLIPDLDNVHISVDTTVTFHLPSSMVEDWIRNPLDNDGIMIKTDFLSDGNKVVYLSENSDPSLRPRLRIWYIGHG